MAKKRVNNKNGKTSSRSKTLKKYNKAIKYHIAHIKQKYRSYRDDDNVLITRRKTKGELRNDARRYFKLHRTQGTDWREIDSLTRKNVKNREKIIFPELNPSPPKGVKGEDE